MKKRFAVPSVVVVGLLIMWFVFGGESTDEIELTATPQTGEFVVDVTSSGELRAKNSKEIMGPQGAREFRVNQLTIQRLIPEGSIVKEGDFIAELDRSEIMGKLQDAQLDLQSAESQVTQAQLDSTLELSQARDNLINLEYALEERQIEVDQSKYESPAVQRQAEIELDKARRQLAQETKNYKTKVRQAEAKLREVEAEMTKKQNEIQKIRELMTQFTVSAPDQGMVIYQRNWDGTKITEGKQISAWNPVVAELPDFSVMESATYINEVDIQKIELGQTVTIGLDAVPDKELTGVVTDVANIGEQRKNYDSKVFEVIIEVNESDSLLRPAMTTSNKILIDKVDDALFVPLETVHAIDSLSFVFLKDGASPVMQQVELGLMNENAVIVQRGVSIEDELYLSVPADTSGIRRNYLGESITQK
ncbi:efflux RND transporter periplasmic adaptor subunit [Gracilimonas mengyeensis]|uniref:Multidrug efflux pump subunit AcrA (Membrane-fusion protein) n=1 Tax=Gracilimonas mengyeensis TaxID=1302730 RepID=A0A521BBX0_9BACT|nr:efflux RND transporter periplasmic adaptor subunit [Gracilimonas mengyeensis]SMO44614.1 Multidrug efflux pump subunit AcrA (membrane-fusion protein) [Gracilimonas mengyeensis]